MTYFLDFDRTLFDTDAYNRSLADEPACAPFREEILHVIRTPYHDLAADDPARLAVWAKVTEVMSSGELTFAPNYLSRFVYPDVPEVLRKLASDAVIITFGELTRQKTKIASALTDCMPPTILYVGDAKKAAYLKTWEGYTGEPAVFVDDRPSELSLMQELFPQMRLFEMRRDAGAGDGRWPVIRSLAELP
jgi:hypothetical protein